MLKDIVHVYYYISKYINKVLNAKGDCYIQNVSQELVNNIIRFNKWCTEFRKQYSSNDFGFIMCLLKILCVYSYINNICYDDLVSMIDLNDILEYLELNNIKNGLIKDNLHHKIDNDFIVAIQCIIEFLNKCAKEKQLKKSIIS